MGGLLRSRRIQDRPPERFHAFMSYTTREDEVREIKPVVDRFLNGYLILPDPSCGTGSRC
jgi:hypothetical protein